MKKVLIKGGKALRGSVALSGAKNSALPVMAAALLTSDKVVVRNRGTQAESCRGAVRAGKDHARVDFDAGAAHGARGGGARFPAGRMRDRGAARGFALEGAGADGRGDRHVARLHRSEGPWKQFKRTAVAGRAHRV